MIQFEYKFNHQDFTPYTYQVTQFKSGDPFFVYALDTTLIGGLAKDGNNWKQTSGRMMPQELVDSIGLYIDDKNYEY